MLRHLLETFERALREDAILFSPTKLEICLDNRVPYVVRSPLTRWDYPQKVEQDTTVSTKPPSDPLVERNIPRTNPFLPYDPRVFVQELSTGRHVILLNKFSLFRGHALIVTKHFEFQLDDINGFDMQAAIECLINIDALIFYNCGKFSGASQPHKHLQLIPLPLAGRLEPNIANSTESNPFLPETGLPIDTLILENNTPGSQEITILRSIQDWAFLHVYSVLDESIWKQDTDPDLIKIKLLTLYQNILETVKRDPGISNPSCLHYNLLFTRRWMMLIPRTQEDFHGIPLNSLGFTGNLLAKTEKQFLEIKNLGLSAILQQVSYKTSKHNFTSPINPPR
jgi:sulfate adenylyltransferase (ADP) / ATP adenylyltransferase